MSDKQKYYINETGLINIQCPSCKKARMISVDKFKGNKNNVKIKCSCQNIFQIDIEFRQKYRKNVNFFGSYKKPLEHEHMSKDCIIINLSLSGIVFKINNDLTIKENDELIVKFTLDN